MGRVRARVLTVTMVIMLVASLFPGYAAAAEFYPSALANGETGLFVAASSKPVQIAESYYNGAAVMDDGSLYMWGESAYGQLGMSAEQAAKEKGRAVHVMDNVQQVALGQWSFAAAVTTSGSLFTWGGNAEGQLGDGTTDDRSTPKEILSGVKQVSLGDGFGIALKNDGTVWTWGDNTLGQLGRYVYEDGEEASNVPCQVLGLTDVASVSAGGYHAGAVTTSGELWMWGYNGDGELGDGSSNNALSPVHVMDGVAQVSLGGLESAAIKTDGSLWMWGNNTIGQIGNGEISQTALPQRVIAENVKQVSISHMQGKGISQPAHVAAVKMDNTLWTWGYNASGQLGDPDGVSTATPEKAMDAVAAVAVADGATTALKVDGTIWTWGASTYTMPVESEYKGGYGSRKTWLQTCIYDGQKWLASLSNASSEYIGGQAYTGLPVEPKPSLTLRGSLLKEGLDYKLEYANNINVGKATVTITGIGDYCGSWTTDFQVGYLITEVALKSSSAVYDGKAHKPEVAYVKAGDRQVPESGYTISFSREMADGGYFGETNDFTTPGEISVHVGGIGDYVGGFGMAFTISSAQASSSEGDHQTTSFSNVEQSNIAEVTPTSKFANPMKVKVSAKVVNAAKIAKKAKKVNALKVTKAVGKISYKNVSKAKKLKKFKVNAKNGSVTVPKGTQKGTYKVKVQVRAAGDSVYDAATKSVTCKIKVK